MTASVAKPFFSSVILHAVAFGLLLISLDLTPTPRQPLGNQEPIIEAVTIDSQQIEQELSKIKELEQQKEQDQIRRQEALERQLSELEKKSTEAEKRRLAEERRLLDLKQRQQQEEQLRKQEEQKLALAKKQQEEEEQNRRLEAERKKQEELRLAEEQRQLKEAQDAQNLQDRQDLNIINTYVGRIADAIEREFNTAGLPPGLSCIFQIRMIPGGDVVEARIDKSSGNTLFDSRAEIAVQRASPLPVPEQPRIFDKMRVIRLTFAPN
jgi:colicin import membrane protein